MGDAEISGPLVPYDYSSEEEEEIPPLKEELKGDSLGEKSCDGGSYHSFPDEMHNQTNFGDKINPDLGKHLTSDHECDSSPSETDKPSRLRGRNFIKDGARRRRYSPHRTDDKLLNDLAYWELLPGRAYDPKRREVYYVCVNNCDRCNEYGCRELLKIIGCEKRFVCCSIERPRVFYAKLNKKEAAKLKGVKGIFIVTMYKSLWKPC